MAKIRSVVALLILGLSFNALETVDADNPAFLAISFIVGRFFFIATLSNSNFPFNAIFLTSYLIDDENYYMGESWRQIFNSPEDIDDEFIHDNYVLKDIYTLEAGENYENEDARAVLPLRKT